jgi:hypothetical protein
VLKRPGERRTTSSRTRGRSNFGGGAAVEVIDGRSEGEGSPMSWALISLGRPYVPSLLDESSDADVDADLL